MVDSVLWFSVSETFAQYDGSSVSFASLRWIMNKGVSYGTSEAAADKLWISNYDCIEKPLMVFIDFGTSVDSNQGVAYMGDSTEIVWLDHHPIEDGFCGKDLEHYINPWLFGGDSSYTAGLLSCILSKAISNLDTSIMEDASLIGDHSRYARFSDDGVATSTILAMSPFLLCYERAHVYLGV